MKKRILVVVLMVVAMVLLVSGCADAVPYTITNASEPYGFWGGVWHGMILVPDFIGSLIWDDVAVYAVNNNGGWYDFGFVGGFGFCIKFVLGFIRELLKTLK